MIIHYYMIIFLILTYSIYCFSSVVDLGFKYRAIKLIIILFVVIIRIVVEVEFAPAST